MHASVTYNAFEMTFAIIHRRQKTLEIVRALEYMHAAAIGGLREIFHN